MQIVGLTGGIGSGKSTVAAQLAARGAVVIDVDAIGRNVIAPGGRAEQAVLEHFGRGIADAAGRIDRAALGRVVFSDPAQLQVLESMSHPAINAEIDHLLDAVDDDAVVVFDMAILLGSRLGQDLPSGRRYGQVVVVEAPETERVRRLVEQRGMAGADARARMAAQPTDHDRRRIADFVIVNDGDLDRLAAAVDRVATSLGL